MAPFSVVGPNRRAAGALPRRPMPAEREETAA
jgi:hypothetical protein